LIVNVVNEFLASIKIARHGCFRQNAPFDNSRKRGITEGGRDAIPN